MQRIDWAKFAAVLAVVFASGACAAGGTGTPSTATRRGTIATTSVAFPRPARS